jgi:hypothetical protein
MSKVSITGNASGTGTFTLAAPNSNSDRTLTLPDNTGTMMLTNTAVAKSQLPAGSVLQVVQATYGVKVDTTSSTFIDTGLTASITPSNTNSKILVIVSQSGVYHQGNADSGVSLRLVRSSTTIITFGEFIGYQLTNNLINMQSISYLDSPSTTSSVTYKTQFANSVGGTGTAVVQERAGNSTSTIILMEIAG